MASIFSKIIAGDIPCYKISETETCFAFLDINPLREGHTLVVPKVEIDQYFNLPDSILTDLTIFSKKIAHALYHTIPCNRIGVVIMGLEVPHAHIHLVPINNPIDLQFDQPKLKLPAERMRLIAENITSKLT
jgi:histidine triad (HIT) family protein